MFSYRFSKDRAEKYLQKNSIPDANYGCVLWTGCQYPFGYGHACFNYKNMGAHKLSYLVRVGPVKKDLCVLHKCDVPQCINPLHLFLGTKADNIFDCIGKGRSTTNQKTHCVNGHSMVGENVRVLSYIKNGKTYFFNRCMTCCRNNDRKRRPRKK